MVGKENKTGLIIVDIEIMERDADKLIMLFGDTNKIGEKFVLFL